MELNNKLKREYEEIARLEEEHKKLNENIDRSTTKKKRKTKKTEPNTETASEEVNTYELLEEERKLKEKLLKLRQVGKHFYRDEIG